MKKLFGVLLCITILGGCTSAKETSTSNSVTNTNAKVLDMNKMDLDYDHIEVRDGNVLYYLRITNNHDYEVNLYKKIKVEAREGNSDLDSIGLSDNVIEEFNKSIGSGDTVIYMYAFKDDGEYPLDVKVYVDDGLAVETSFDGYYIKLLGWLSEV